jgi:hypothetical protein
VCKLPLLSLTAMSMMTVSGKSKLLSVGLCTRTRRRCKVAEEGVHLYGEVNTLMTSS